MSAESNDPVEADREVERLSVELKQQVQLAKDRISDRYAKLIEEPSFEPPPEVGPAS